MLFSIDRKACFIAVDDLTLPNLLFDILVSGSQTGCDPLSQVVDRPVRDRKVEVPVKQLGLFPVRQSLMEPTESGLGHDIWPKPPLFGTVRMLSNNLVTTRTVVFAELVLGNSGWNRKRYVNNSP